MTVTEDRIESLERQVRRQRRWNMALSALVVVGGLMAATSTQQVSDVIRARRIEVVNDEGVKVVMLEAFNGGGVIATYDEKGRMIFVALHEKDERGLTFGTVTTRNGKRQNLVQLGATSDGEGMVTTMNGKGQELVQLGATMTGQGSITTMNGKGVNLVHITADRSGSGAVVAQDAAGNIKATLP